MTKKTLLDRSLDWIRTHPDAMNMDVPDDLLSHWIFDDEGVEPRSSGFYYSVFTYGYLERELAAAGFGDAKVSIPLKILREKFGLWQMKLGFVELHRRKDILQFAPLSLFTFPDDEAVKYWPLPPQS